MEYTQSLDYVYFVLSLNFLTVKELSNQHMYFKGILTFRILSLRLCCFGKEVLLLFPQKMRTCGFLPENVV